MGTLCACQYATAVYGYYERTRLLQRHQQCLKFSRRFIDDGIGIWIDPDMPTNLPPDAETNWIIRQPAWKAFVADLDYNGLCWTVETPSTKLNFLDLSISIQRNGHIHFCTFQKEHNLYLYLPPQSAHPPSCLRGLVVGLLQKYWKQNTTTSAFAAIITQFYRRLRRRGHQPTDLDPLFLEAAELIERKANEKLSTLTPPPYSATQSDTIDEKILYLHWRYHPYGIRRRELRTLYKEYLEGHTGYDRMVVAQSRPPNIKSKLVSINFTGNPGNRASETILWKSS